MIQQLCAYKQKNICFFHVDQSIGTTISSYLECGQIKLKNDTIFTPMNLTK